MSMLLSHHFLEAEKASREAAEKAVNKPVKQKTEETVKTAPKPVKTAKKK